MSRLLSQVISGLTTTPYIRQIDAHYHTAMIADNTEDLINYHRAFLNLQVESNAANVDMMREITRRQDAGNDLLRSIREEISALGDSIEHLEETMEQGLTLIAARLLKQQGILREIVMLPLF